MELKKPRIKNKYGGDVQSAFPLFVESELGLSADDWVPIVCSGVLEGDGVVVSAPADVIALHTMGDFGKGSDSRSKSGSKFPPFLRERQYAERTKWTNATRSQKSTKKSNENSGDTSDVLDEMRSLLDDLVSREIISIEENTEKTDKETEIIDLLSSDEDKRSDDDETAGVSKTTENEDLSNCDKMDSSSGGSETRSFDLEFPLKSVVVLPDSDTEKDDYFTDLKPKLCVDESDLCERLVLTLEEAYFLAYGIGCLQIFDESKRSLTLESAWNSFCDSKPNFPIMYTVYHHFRSKGWIVKPGIKFGGDFLLYKKGRSFYHASFVVLVRTIIEKKDAEELHMLEYDWVTIQNFIRMSATTGKEILFANVVIPENYTMDTFKTNPESIKNARVCETLFRRWVSNRKKKDGNYL